LPAGGVASDEEVRRLARELLAGDEYARYRIDEEAWLAFFERLARGLDALRIWFEGLRIESPLLYWSALAGLALVAVVLLFHVAWSIRAALRAEPPDAERGKAAPRRDLADEAARLASEGHFLDAARRLEHACLDELMSRGWIELARGDANSVLRRRLSDAPLSEPRRRELLGLLDRLESRLFRDPVDDAELYRGWRRLHARLQDGAVA
jgi:hypothetical protein